VPQHAGLATVNCAIGAAASAPSGGSLPSGVNGRRLLGAAERERFAYPGGGDAGERADVGERCAQELDAAV
jgi:hypothetical protein